jgi:hypothetical protein
MAPITELGVVQWANAGASNPDVVRTLRDEFGMFPSEGARPVTLADGSRVSLVQAVESGEIEAYDAPMVACTWPGEGWTFSGDEFSWTRPVSPEALASMARAYDPDGAGRIENDEVLAAQFAGEIARHSSDFDGANVTILRGQKGSVPEEGWRDGLDDELFSTAARSAYSSLAGVETDAFADYRRRWLERPTLGPTTAAV